MMRPPSSMVGTTPLGFMSRYHFWSLPPNAMPTFSRSYLSPHSSAHHNTFMTLIELARPQIFIARLSSVSAFPRGLAVDDPQELLRTRIVAGLGRDTLEPDVRFVNPDGLRPHHRTIAAAGAARQRLALGPRGRIAAG